MQKKLKLEVDKIDTRYNTSKVYMGESEDIFA